MHADPAAARIDGPQPGGGPVPAHPAGYDALRRSVAWGVPRPRSLLVARGPDAVKFVDNFTTAAVAAVRPGAGTEGFFTDARGWVICLAAILRTEDGVSIDLPEGMAARLLEHLEHYHIREQVELADESAAWGHRVVVGPRAAEWLATRSGAAVPAGLLDHGPATLGGAPVSLVRSDAYGPEGFLVQAAREHLGRLDSWLAGEMVVRAADEALEAARIEAGSPAPEDIPEKTLPQELGRDHRAISFTKGCYLGQETVARIDSLGHVNRRLAAVAIDRWSAPPIDVRSGDETIGRLTSACFSPALGSGLGLGLMQAKAIDSGRPLSAHAATARIVTMPIDLAAAPATDAAEVHGRPCRGAAAAPPAEEVLLEARRFCVVRVAESGGEGGPRQREIVRHPGSVVIVPLVSRSRVCLVEVVRVAVGATLLELPAGTLDRVESLEEAARRELAEETGYRAGAMTPLGSMWMSPGILRERMHLFVAEELVAGPQALEPGEQIRTRVVEWDEAVAMCLDGRIEDAKSIAAILLVAARRR